MKFASKSRMGFLLVLFPEEDQQTPSTTTTPLQESKKSFNLLLKRTNSANLLHKAQSTISICLLLVFTTFLLFTLSALPPSSTAGGGGGRRIYALPRRHLAVVPKGSVSNFSHALQGMGTLYRRGTRAMSELVVAHASDSLSLAEFRLFVRLIYRSGVTARSDLLFVFPSKMAGFDDVVVQENDSFLRLVTQYGGELSRNRSASFAEAHFGKLSKKEKESGEPIWGRRIKGGSNGNGSSLTESTRASYGSVVGFDVDELDPENALSGFLDHVPMSLRRWACYPMLLGRVRRNFKHIVLVDMKEMLLLGDQLGRVRNHSPESVILTTTSQSGKHGKKNSDKSQSTRQKSVNPGIIAGGSRGVRRLSNAMLTDIVRAAMQQHNKKRYSVTESGLFNQLVTNEFVLKNVKVIVSSESVPELSSLVGSKSGPGLVMPNHTVIRRGTNGNMDGYHAVMKHICSTFPLDSKVYSDC